MRDNFNRGRGGGGNFRGRGRGRGGFRGKPYERNSFRGGDGNRDFKMQRGGGDNDSFRMKKMDDNSFGGDRRSFSPRGGGFNRGGGGRGRGGGFRGGFQDRRGSGHSGRGGFKNKSFGDDSFKQKKNIDADDNDDDNSEDDSGSDSSEQPTKKMDKTVKKGKNFTMVEQKRKEVSEDEESDEDDDDSLDDDSSEDQKPKQAAKLGKGGKVPEVSKQQQKGLVNDQKGKGQLDLQGKRKTGPEVAASLVKKPKVENNPKHKASDDDDDEDDEDDDDDDDEDDDDEEDEDDDDEDDDDDDDSEDQKPKEMKNAKKEVGILNQKGKNEMFSSKQQAKQEAKSLFENKKSAVEARKEAPTSKNIKELAREAQSARNTWLEKTNANRLYVGQLPLHCTVQDLKALSPDIIDVFIPSSGKRKRRTQFAFLSFENAKKVEENMRRLQNTKIGNQLITVNLAREKPPQSQQQQQQAASLKNKNLRTVYISGLHESTNLAKVIVHFPKATKASFEHQRRSALLSFVNEADAAEAVKTNQGLKIDGVPVSVDFSRTAGELTNQSKYMTPVSKQQQSPAKHSPGIPASTFLTPGATPKDISKQTPKAVMQSTPKEVMKSAVKESAKFTPKDLAKFTPKEAAKSASKSATKSLSKKETFKPRFEQMDSDDDDDDDDNDSDSDDKPQAKASKKHGSAHKEDKMSAKKGKKPVISRKEDSDEDDSDDDDDDDDYSD